MYINTESNVVRRIQINKNYQIMNEVDLCAKAAGMELKQVLDLAEYAKSRNESLVSVFYDRGIVDEREFSQRLAELIHIPHLSEEIDDISDDILENISPAIATKYDVMPIREVDGNIQVACWNPFEWEKWDEIEHLVPIPMTRVLSSRSVLRSLIKENYGVGADTIDHLVSKRSGDAIIDDGDHDAQLEEGAANEPTVINLVYQLIADGIKVGSTDIHFEPCVKKYRVRYRIDGMLEDVAVPASLNVLKQAVVSRIKIMSGLDIAEKRIPQDGRAQISLHGREYDLRVSVLPGVYGEAVVIRVQNRDSIKLDLEILGFTSEEEKRIVDLIQKPYGLVLVTGPTGSGKTTTLYTCLKRICRPEIKIITIEDPVEYWMEDILQMQVNEAAKFTFARALRSMLRHDPDVMLIGEIRDHETAEIAIRSALTGHLVFATLHTNDAASAVSRLCDIGIEPFLVSTSLIGVLAQRLVRKICPHCKEEVGPEQFQGPERELLLNQDKNWNGKLWRGRGCGKCRFTGYSGRIAIGEVVLVTNKIRQLIQTRESADSIKKVAAEEGTRFLRDTAMLAVKSGMTCISEVVRITQEDI